MASIDKAKSSIQNLKYNFGKDTKTAAAGDEVDLVNFIAKVDRTLAKVLSDLDDVNRVMGDAKSMIEQARTEVEQGQRTSLNIVKLPTLSWGSALTLIDKAKQLLS